MTPSNGLVLKGINYDVGTNYELDYLSREVWNDDLMQGEIRVIKDDLHCNAVNVFGSDIGRLTATAKFALENGLEVWLQPRLIDSTPDEMLAHLAELAHAAEQLRMQHSKVTLNVGCELSIFMSGLAPGRSFMQRGRWLGRMWWWWMLMPRFNKKLNMHLKKAVEVARSNFKGQITYGSGIWESVDWTPFDIVGLNYYREAANQSTYVNDLRRFHRFNKPIVITEFGCCSFEGAHKKGGSGDTIVDYFSHATPQLKKLYKRDEKVQADYIVDLLGIYRREGIHGAFVFEFTEPSHPHSSDPRLDLDMASYGVVKVHANGTDSSAESLHWEPKVAFHEIARIYGADAT